MYRELTTSQAEEHEAQEALEDADINADGTVAGRAPRKTLRQAVIQIIIADVSMSLDKRAGRGRRCRAPFRGTDHWPGIVGGDDGRCCQLLAGLLHKHRWIAWLGLAIILFVASACRSRASAPL